MRVDQGAEHPVPVLTPLHDPPHRNLSRHWPGHPLDGHDMEIFQPLKVAQDKAKSPGSPVRGLLGSLKNLKAILRRS